MQYVVTAVTDGWVSLFGFFRTFALSDPVSALFTNFLCLCLVPLVVALLLARLMPVLTSRSKAFIFSLPVSLFCLQTAMPSWLAAIDTIENPEVPSPSGLFGFAVAYTILVLLLFASLAFAGRLAARDRFKESTNT